jgi:ATP-binding cassette, subfamily B, multidrug efflux pump
LSIVQHRLAYLRCRMEQQRPRRKFFDITQLKRVYGFVRPYRSQFWWSLSLSLLLAIISPVRGLLVQYTVDKGVRGRTEKIPGWLNHSFDYLSQHFFTGYSTSPVVRFIIIITIIQAVLLIAETLMRFFFSFITAALGQNVIKDLRNTVYQKVLGLNLRQFDTTPIGTLTTRTINDIESINDIFAEGLIPIISDLLTIIITLATMFWIDAKLTLISLIPFPIMIIATYYFKNSVNRSFMKVRNAVAALNAFVQEHLTGMAVVQAFAAEGREMKKFDAINQEHRNANINAIFAYSVFFPIVEIVLAVSTGLLVWWVAHSAPQSAAAAAVEDYGAGKLIAFVLFLNQIFRPLRVIADKFNVIQMGLISSERVFKVLDNSDEMPDTGKVEKRLQGKVQFEQVWFAYVEQNWVLKDVNFTIQPGQTLAIVGNTGSGKTTIISLLNRLYQVQKGRIKLDDTAIQDFTLESLRRQIGVVLQDVFLFSGSILDNVTLRNPAITRQQAEDAAKLIGMHDFIMQLPGGYDFNVMERGATLSVGQRQLLSFIRCLLYDPSILILDEATSSIDTESEQLIQQAIDKLVAGRTAIIIAHRLSTIRKADNILVLERGEVKEMGNHEQLLQLGGQYAKLYRMQFEQKKQPQQV